MSVQKPKGRNTYSVVIKVDGKQKWITTSCTTLEAAQQREAEIKAEMKVKGENRIPDLIDSLRKRAHKGLNTIIDEYIEAKCPDKRMKPRKGFVTEESNLQTIKKWWGGKDPKKITIADCDDYCTYRRKTVDKKRGTGERTTELELQSLANAMKWAVRTRKLDKNPLERRPRYRDLEEIRHARECMPSCADEAHILVAEMFKQPQSEVCGWGYLLALVTGMRSMEMRLLRTDAKRVGLICQPGLIEGNTLHIQRCKGGKNPRIKLDDPNRPWIRPVIEMLLAWKAERYPNSPWFLPGREGEQLSKCAINKSVCRITKRLELKDATGEPVARTAHGARAYYVTTRLAQGNDTEHVATEVGQGSGDELVRSVYGIDPDEFHVEHYTSLAHLYRWLPNTAAVIPSWTHMTLAEKPFGPIAREAGAPENIINLPLAVGQ